MTAAATPPRPPIPLSGHSTPPGARMVKLDSIRARLSLVFGLFLLLVVGVGLFSINRLGTLNEASAEIRSHWLSAAPVLGELNNLISDFRAAEAATLIALEPVESATAQRELAALTVALNKTRAAYEVIPKDAVELQLYGRFTGQWDAYRRAADEVMALVAAGKRREAIAMNKSASREAFNAASNTLTLLVEHNVEGARLATEREAGIYRASRSLIIGAILLAALCLAGAIFYITRSISDPLLDLAGRMHRLAANETRLEIHGAGRADEIGEMARAVQVFRNNAIDLVESQKALSEQAQTLREALDAERRLTTQQQNFVSMTSHEFRTPLTIIDSHAQRLIRMRERLEPADLAERARGIRAAVTRMTSLIDSLLNTSRVFDGDVRLHREEIDFAGVVRQACQMHREVAPAACLVEAGAGQAIPATGDPRLLFQAVSNLLSNAIKYSPSGSPIEVAVTVTGDKVQVAVSDHGIGIPEKDRAHLFERYFRGSNVSDVAGTGVGLYLVDMVARLHGGGVAVESAERGGSRFVLTLPIARSARAAAPQPA